MRGRRKGLLLAAVALAVALVAGGVIWAATSGNESSEAEYEVAVVAARDRMDASLLRITKATSPADLVSRISEAADQADIAADEIEEVGSAPGFEDETEQLVSTFRKFAGELEGTAQTLGDPTLGDSVENVTSLSFEQWIALNKVFADLKSKGIDVEPLARH